MTGVDEILSYKRNPDDDFYGLLGCDENSSVSINFHSKLNPTFSLIARSSSALLIALTRSEGPDLTYITYP